MSKQTTTVLGATPVETVRLVVATCRNARPRNEDAVGVGGWILHGDHPDPLEITVAIRPGRPVAIAVADGMGGHPDGDWAARIAAEQLTRPAPPGESTEITDAFRRADTAIRIAAGDRSRGMGCTAATLFLGINGNSTIANIGDVRVYRILDGYLGQLTVDDRPAAAASGPVTRCLGGKVPTTEVHIHHLTLQPGDRLMLCTDGLHDAVALSATQLPGSWDAKRLVAELMQAAQRGDEGDNVTVAVIDLPATETTPEAETTATIAETAAEPDGLAPPPAPEHRPSWLRYLVSRIRPSGDVGINGPASTATASSRVDRTT